MLWHWSSMQVTLYTWQFWICTVNHLKTLGDNRLLNTDCYWCPMWRIWWLTDLSSLQFVAWHCPKEVYINMNVSCHKILHKITLWWFRMHCKDTTGPMTKFHYFLHMHQPASPPKLKPTSLCTISNWMTHVTSTFHAFQKVVIQYIEAMDSNVRKVSYFSEGVESQHKNKKNWLGKSQEQFWNCCRGASVISPG